MVFNPEMDCGCFGEAIHLTHMQTFIKNIVLCVLASASFFPFSSLGHPKKRKYVSFAIVSSIVVAFAIHSLLFIPLVDFTDYKPSVQLSSSQSFSETSGSGDMYDAVFVYEKDGVQKEFRLESLPDSTWTYISTRTVMKEDGHNGGSDLRVTLPVIGRDGNYHNELAADGPVMVVSIYNPESLSLKRWNRIADFVSESASEGFIPLVLVSSTPQVLDEVMMELDSPEITSGLMNYIWYSDYKALISMNRSNGGITYFHDGYLLRKWASLNYPDSDDLSSTSVSDATEILLSYSTKGTISFQGLMLVLFAVMLLV